MGFATALDTVVSNRNFAFRRKEIRLVRGNRRDEERKYIAIAKVFGLTNSTFIEGNDSLTIAVRFLFFYPPGHTLCIKQLTLWFVLPSLPLFEA